MIGWVKRAVLIGLLGLVVVESLLLLQRSHALRIERQRSSDLDQQIRDMERAIKLTESLREYTGEVAREAADLERSIDRAAGTEDRLSADLVDVLERLRRTAPGNPGSP